MLVKARPALKGWWFFCFYYFFCIIFSAIGFCPCIFIASYTLHVLFVNLSALVQHLKTKRMRPHQFFVLFYKRRRRTQKVFFCFRTKAKPASASPSGRFGINDSTRRSLGGKAWRSARARWSEAWTGDVRRRETILRFLKKSFERKNNQF